MISLIICTYNGEIYIEECLESVFSQTIAKDKLEIIIVDDASTDHTVEMLKKYKEKYPERITLILCEKNSHESMIITRNTGVECAKGKYIMFLDQDDCYCTDAFELLYEKMEADKDLDYIEYSYNDTNEDGVVTRTTRKNKHGMDKYEIDNEDKRKQLAKERILPGTTFAWSKIYRRSFLVDNNIRHNDREIRTGYSDNFFSGLIGCYCKKFANLYEPLYFYRNYAGSYSHASVRNDKNQFERYKVGKIYLEECARRGLLQEQREYVEFVFLRTFLVKTFHRYVMTFDPIPYKLLHKMQSYIYQNCPKYKENQIAKKWNSFDKPFEWLEQEWTPEYLDQVKEQLSKEDIKTQKGVL